MFEWLLNRVLCCKCNPGGFRGNENEGGPQNAGNTWWNVNAPWQWRNQPPHAPWGNQQPAGPWIIQQPVGPWGNQNTAAPWAYHQPAAPWDNQQPAVPRGNQQNAAQWGNQQPDVPRVNQPVRRKPADRQAPAVPAREKAAVAGATAPEMPINPFEALKQLRVQVDEAIYPIEEIFRCDECRREFGPGEGVGVLNSGDYCLICVDAFMDQLDNEDENEQEWDIDAVALPPRAAGHKLGERKDQLKQLMELEEQELVLNTEAFTCGVCLTDYEAGEGAVLRECLHTFCRDCLAELIRQSDDEVICPYREDTYACGSALREFDVRALVSAADYEAYLAKTFRIAGARMKDAFHCRTPNCGGWCVKDDEADTFECPLCHKENCIGCQAIHENKTCKEYADDQWKDQAKLDIEQFLQNGTAMHCPTCDIVVMKDDGCDWVMCLLCKTEICWARRMRRWGPGGKGDYSGGCQCHVDGKLCHPQCNNCH